MHSLLAMALAAVGVSGGPVVVAETPGGAVSDVGSWYAVKAVTSGAREQEPAAMAIYDARPNVVEDRPVGTFSVQVRDGATPKLQGARAIVFRPHGWEEHPVDGALSADVSVFTLGKNVFAVVLALHGVSTPLSLVTSLDGTGAATGTRVGGAVSVDDGLGRPFGVWVGSTLSLSVLSFTEGPSYQRSQTFSVTGTGDVTVGVVLSFNDDPQSAESIGASELSNHGAPDTWLTPVLASWAAYRASFATPGGTVPPRWVEADANAQATLRMNLDSRSRIGTGTWVGAGIARSKTHADHFYLLDSSIAALGLSEWSAQDAFTALSSVTVAQVPLTNGEAGLIPNRVDDLGVAPALNNPLATDAYSAPPVFPVVMRTIWERSAQDVAAQTALDGAHHAAAALHDWWKRRRDLDGNGLVEINGSVEAEMPESPRFSFWGSTADLPVPDNAPRARLNAVDLNAWLQWTELELWRVAQVVPQTPATNWLSFANSRAARIDDPDLGFWDDDQGAWVDYALDAGGRKVPQGPRTPSSFWPFATGTERDPVRLRRAVAGLTNPAQLWTACGVASVAASETVFSPDEPWRGAVSPWQTYFVLQGLFRFGFEDEAEQLRTRLLDTIASQPAMFAHYGAFTGVGLEAAGTSTTAAVFIEALRRRYEEETFALTSGGVPTSRAGQIRRMYRFSDGMVLAEISVGGTHELPRTRFTGDADLFSGDPMTIAFEDVTGLMAGREITVSLPAFDEVDGEIQHRDGSVQKVSLSLKEPPPLSVTLQVDDTLRLQRYHFLGDQSCGCGAGGGAPLGALALLIACAMAWRNVRRNERRTASASQRGRRCL